MKLVLFHGDSLARIREFPEAVRRDLGYQLARVQSGHEPDDWKPMKSVGLGVREIRVRDRGGAYRAIYLATVGDAVHVLHAFKKTTQKTAKHDLDLAARRLKEVGG